MFSLHAWIFLRSKIVDDASCPCCGEAEESLIHAIWTCPATQDVWGSKDSPFQKCCGVVTSLGDYKACLQENQSLQQNLEGASDSSLRTVWCPPPTDLIKVNWDAALNNNKGCNGVGIIVRDCMGRCVGARSLTHILKVDAKTAETIAALGAIQFSNEMGFLDAVF